MYEKIAIALFLYIVFGYAIEALWHAILKFKKNDTSTKNQQQKRKKRSIY